MFSLFKPKTKNTNQTTETLKLSGLHCTSCAVNIDLTLEDVPGIISSSTNYQKSESVITFDTTKTNQKTITSEIHKLGYEVVKEI